MGLSGGGCRRQIFKNAYTSEITKIIKEKGAKMNFVTEKELTVALDSLNEWMAENPDLKLMQ